MLHLITVTQTPLVRFKLSLDQLKKKYKTLEPNLNMLKEGEEYVISPGGVTRTVYPFLLRLSNEKPHWVSLNPNAPPKIFVNNITIHHVSIPAEVVKGYGKAKEIIWQVFHRIKEGICQAQDLMWSDEFADYIYYNRRVSKKVMELDKEEDFDLIYIHDFQQIPLGSMLTTVKPKIFRWHIPMEQIPNAWLSSIETYLNSYDLIIISSERYSKVLEKLKYKGKIAKVYPFIDPSQYKYPSQREVEEFSARYGISNEDKVALVVARMDPMKGQDRAIKALKMVKKRIKKIKLMLVGNGSFSKTGIGLDKAERWSSHLKSLVKELELEKEVIFTGYLNQRDLEKAYSRADLVILPSVIEGFGLVIIEGWLYKKPALVSNKAGVADLINNYENGVLIDPDDIEGIAEEIVKILSDEKLSEELGKSGFETSKKCHVEEGIKNELEILQSISK